VATFDFVQTFVLFHRGKQILGKSILSILKINLGTRTVNSGAAFLSRLVFDHQKATVFRKNARLIVDGQRFVAVWLKMVESCAGMVTNCV
jgi:hypothetical protein